MLYFRRKNGLSFYRPNQTQGAPWPRSDRGRAKSLRLPQAKTGAQAHAKTREIKRGITGKGEGLRRSAEICTKERGSDSR